MAKAATDFEAGDRVYDEYLMSWGSVVRVEDGEVIVRYQNAERIWAEVYSKPGHLDYLTK